MNWRFWVITITTLVAMTVTISLGLWQLDRAEQKLALQSAMDNRSVELITDADLAILNDPIRAMYRSVRLRGRWVQGRTVFLDNRTMNGKSGFIVVTPLRLENQSAVIMVQRGWVQRNFMDRTAVAPISTSSDLVQISGYISTTPSKLYELGQAELGIIRQNLDIDAFRNETGLPLMPVSIVQTDTVNDGLLRDWPKSNLGVQKHQGYAFQWFGITALIAVLYVWFQMVKKLFNRREQVTARSDQDE